MKVQTGTKQRKQFTNTQITLNMVTSACAESTVYAGLLNGSLALLISRIRSYTARSVACKFHHGTDIVAVSGPFQAQSILTCAEREGSYDWPLIVTLFLI